MDPILNQSRPERLKESLASCFSCAATPTSQDVVLATAPSDHGVLRNGGRAGTRWGPRALISTFKKMARPAHPLSIFVRECTEQEWEAQNFAEAIKSQSEKLQKLLSAPTLIHLGGGHDHILPLLMALSDTPVCVLNIDAHLDTRIDPEPHSGNPFRQFAQQSHQGFSIHQVGIQPFANTVSTQTALSEGEMHLLMRDQCRDEAHLAAFLARLEASLASNARVVFSLDCDALESSAVEAVSAPNHDGLSVEQVKYLIAFYRDLCVRRGQAPIFGVYEFNPLYDTVSSRSARSLSALLYDMMI